MKYLLIIIGLILVGCGDIVDSGYKTPEEVVYDSVYVLDTSVVSITHRNDRRGVVSIDTSDTHYTIWLDNHIRTVWVYYTNIVNTEYRETTTLDRTNTNTGHTSHIQVNRYYFEVETYDTEYDTTYSSIE